MRYSLILLLLLLFPPTLLFSGCGGHQAAAAGSTEAASGETSASSGDEDPIEINYKQIPEAVVEKNIGSGPRRDVNKLRRVLCEGYENQPLIFYHVIVSTHWHYYWLCSDQQARRASSRVGVSRLRSWLEGFKKKAKLLSRDCPAANEQRVLSGSHESGIQAYATCSGQVVLTFPDGGQTSHFFTSAAGRGVPSTGGMVTAPPPTQGTCPACPSCPPPRCPVCPTQAACPPPRACPACPPAQSCPSCKEKMVQAGRIGFKQGVDKACKRICTLIYKKCRSIDPKTALCYKTAEYCADHCTK